MIPVTKSFLPPIENYKIQVQRAYANEWLTNRGELVLELEQKTSDFLGLADSNMLAMCNGTIPLQIAIKLLGKGGDIITTPFSYVATMAAIVWGDCTPVFVDIHPDYLTIDESKIEELITERTTCILATHVFGNPCAIEAIQEIADKYNLKVIYDAAHCFGVQYQDESIFEYGDISTCSFHATKLFHTGEGGALFCTNPELFHQVFYSHNFGHDGPEKFHGLGVNGKISELQAAMGLSVLPFMTDILDVRGSLVEQYLEELNFDVYRPMKLRKGTTWNYSYFPIVFDSESSLLKAISLLNKNDIFPRRYFYPSLNTLNFLKNKIEMPVSEGVANRIVCLPLYHSLGNTEVSLITRLINSI